MDLCGAFAPGGDVGLARRALRGQRSSIAALCAAIADAPRDLGPHASPEGDVTLLFTDIGGSTEIIEQVGDQRWYRILRDHRALVEHLVRAFDGSVVKSQGDGF